MPATSIRVLAGRAGKLVIIEMDTPLCMSWAVSNSGLDRKIRKTNLLKYQPNFSLFSRITYSAAPP